MSNVTDSVPSEAAIVELRVVQAAVVAGVAVDPAGPTGLIIPFPARVKPMAATATPVAPEVRLARALKSLSVALAEQRVVLSSWREAMGELKSTTAGLTDSLNRYRANLATLGENVSSLREKALALEAIADGVVGTEG